MLWQLQERTGRKIHQLFDLVTGTSTGGILAAALAIRCVSLEECEEIYRCVCVGLICFPKALTASENPEKPSGGLHAVMTMI